MSLGFAHGMDAFIVAMPTGGYIHLFYNIVKMGQDVDGFLFNPFPTIVLQNVPHSHIRQEEYTLQ